MLVRTFAARSLEKGRNLPEISLVDGYDTPDFAADADGDGPPKSSVPIMARQRLYW
jgi:hypothetical protein